MSEEDNSKSFSTEDFNSKIAETINLAVNLRKHPLSKNLKVNELLKIQCVKVLELLSKLNQNGSSSSNCDFTKLNFADSHKMSLLTEINDSIIDKIIHYKETISNIASGKSDLIEVQMKLNQNNPKILIKDFNDKKNLKRKLSQTEWTPSPKRVMFLSSSAVKRPQIVYNMKVDNNYSTPFIPKIRSKPNALLSLEESIKPIPITNLVKRDYNVPTHFYPHPYQKEIESFEVDLDFYDNITVEVNKPSSENLPDVKLVTTKNQLMEMVEVLKGYKEIAIDVEHHYFRSYQGLTSLLQISTDDDDYIIDVYPLWNEMQLLNEVFTCKSILKVFHGAEYDIIWLQRDLGLYVVNMFDTGIAARILTLPHYSLSYLVKYFCDFSMDKQYQLADWRMRPIPEEMLQYARYDTHFLLYIYRMLKQDLLAKSNESANLLRTVMNKSRDVCLNRYEKKLLEPNDHFVLIWKNNLRFNNRQMSALKALFAWRDAIARSEDESTSYVLPNNLLLKICELLPREQQGILACCNPIPPLIRQYINEIHKIILDCRSKPIGDITNNIDSTVTVKQDISIDLTNDYFIDHHEKDKYADKGDNLHHTIVPLLTWSSEVSSFTLTNEPDTQMDVDPIVPTENEIKSLSVSDMFTSNMACHVKKQTKKKFIQNKIDKILENCISPYQRYLRSVKKD